MKLLLLGHNGWIGHMYMKLLDNGNVPYITTDLRYENPVLFDFIQKNKCTHVLCCSGRTHGTHNGIPYNTIDYLQENDMLDVNINDNLYIPLSIGIYCKDHHVHFTYIGTGCIYEYDNLHLEEPSPINGFTEKDIPNFKGSNYSLVRGYTDRLLSQIGALNLRIRMPITNEAHKRNFVTKIIAYKKICSRPNSMSVLDDLLPISLDMLSNNITGTFNFTNPGHITHNKILEMYRDIVDPSFQWDNFTVEEHDAILKSKRSNNYLDTSKISQLYDIPNIIDSVRASLLQMKMKMNIKIQ